MASQLPSRATIHNIIAEAGLIAEAHLHQHTRGRTGTTLGHDGSEYFGKKLLTMEFHTGPGNPVLSAGPTHVADGTAAVQLTEAERRMAEIEESGAALTGPHTTAPLLTTIGVVASDMAVVEQKFGRDLFARQLEMKQELGMNNNDEKDDSHSEKDTTEEEEEEEEQEEQEEHDAVYCLHHAICGGTTAMEQKFSDDRGPRGGTTAFRTVYEVSKMFQSNSKYGHQVSKKYAPWCTGKGIPNELVHLTRHKGTRHALNLQNAEYILRARIDLIAYITECGTSSGIFT